MRRVLVGFVYIIGLVASLAFVTGCNKPGAPSMRNPFTKPFLMLSQAQFEKVKSPDGSENPVPGAARLELVYKVGNKWESSFIEDPESNVFHKAMIFKPRKGVPGILTIGANKAMLKLWRYQDGGNWVSETLWITDFGGEQNRLRDMEIGDVTGDGNPDIVIATHDQGVVAVLRETATGWEVTELDRTPNTFVHEIEIGDIDGDGMNEIFATPSAPNKMDGTPQPGKILMFKYVDGKFVKSVVDEFPERHVKEILVADLFGKGQPDLYAALETDMSQLSKQSNATGSVIIKKYSWEKNALVPTHIATLYDLLCRFLTQGDVDQDGKIELIASPMKNGVWMLRPSEPKWLKKKISSDSSGFEHATLVYDLDGDGNKEIYVAADDQNQLHKITWNGKRFVRTVIYTMQGNRITFGLMAGHL